MTLDPTGEDLVPSRQQGAEYLPIMFILFQLTLKTMNQKYFLKVLPLNQVSAE